MKKLTTLSIVILFVVSISTLVLTSCGTVAVTVQETSTGLEVHCQDGACAIGYQK